MEYAHAVIYHPASVPRSVQARATAERAAAAEERAAAHEADAAELRRACEVKHNVPRPRTTHGI